VTSVLPSGLSKKSQERATKAYEKQLSEKAHSYLLERGLDEQAISNYRLGSVEVPEPGHEPYQGMLSIPYLTPTGPVGFKFRFLEEHRQPKYLVPTGQRAHLFNVNAFHNSDSSIAICEGELDTLVMDSVVGVSAVGVAGVEMWKDYFTRCFEGFENIYIMADNDVKENGENPGLRLANRIIDALPWARIIYLPAGEDLNSTVLKQGPQYVLDLLKPPVDEDEPPF
jgi:DNA primase